MTRRVIVNGETRRVRAIRLDRLLEEIGADARWVATALNGEFVPRDERAATPIADGDRIEIVAPMEGG